MTVDDTAPIAAQAPADTGTRRLDPWKLLACVSTAVSVATIATLVWTVNKVSDDETPAERLSAAAGVSTPAAEPAPAEPEPPASAVPVAQPQRAPSAPVTPSATHTAVSGDSPWDRYFPMQGRAPSPAGVPASTPGSQPAAVGMPPVNFASLPTPNITVNPGLSIDAIIAAVSGTAGWVGGGTLNLLGDILVASAMNNGGGPRPTDPLAALAAPLSRIPPPQLPRELDVTKIPPPQWPRELDVTKIPPPQWPRELDVTKIPPPQWPRELDVTKIPPPHVHWDRILPRF